MADPRDAELLNLRAYVGTLERQLADAKDLASEYQRRQAAAKAAVVALRAGAVAGPPEYDWLDLRELASTALEALQ